ncbi:Na+/H+ antiporter subunit E [Cellulomonas carbonis]|uniref:Sodium:proton antiporter n=1 Tax=Cellulomonas carbonis T26 TaxID=947969 RepID=A0A0A0BT67_9CELL|nr:Na+/H+ antiporter subunit E [Cellulomonas carbonis]KGM10877.1 sodium:proton antiporter [Cellulomonas carbonis T26]GGC00397.1 hypothetical protein GCM10010972_11450 [Cellulomonas carbonis]
MSLHPRRRALRVRVATALWLAVVWAMLWGNFAVGTLLVGLVLGVVVVAALPMPQIDSHVRARPLRLLGLAGWFLAEVVRASWQVAFLALHPRRTPRSAVVAVRLRAESDLYLTLTAAVTSLIPGSVIVEAHRVTGTLYVHVLDVGLSGGVEGARHHALDTEARILRALASDDELAAAGLSTWRPGDPLHEPPADAERAGTGHAHGHAHGHGHGTGHRGTTGTEAGR